MDESRWILWAKSDAAGRPHSLLGHLLDTGAVAELIWDEYLAQQTQVLWNEASDGHGRDLFVLTCALHDIGKASPAFQVKDDDLWADVQAAGYDGKPNAFDRSNRTHWRVGAVFLNSWLVARGARSLKWIVSVIEGHHGRHEAPHSWLTSSRTGDGDGQWEQARTDIAGYIADQFGIDPGRMVGPTPTMATQLAFAGHVVMADWIASSHLFPGRGTVPVGAGEARERAATAWHRLGFAPGWRPEALALVDPLGRFSRPTSRPLQTLGLDVARSVPAPGLILVEAPMGEGKTEAGLAMAEVLAARFGCRGLVFAMPTQGTTDAMYERILRWAADVDASVPVSLLHGKAMLNEDWRRRRDQAPATSSDEVDEYGMAPRYDDEGRPGRYEPVAPEWVEGRHRGLLAHLIVATVDQVLYAATRTKFVSVRHAGLAGKVLIIDEVHAYDVYMSVFLHDLLTWCAGASVPVVLMSATLPPALRDRLIAAYRRGLQGAPTRREGPDHEPAPTPSGYPIITIATPEGVSAVTTQPHRADLMVDVEQSGTDPDDLDALAARVEAESSDGGCILVILDTVARAQGVFERLRGHGVPTRLLHGRLTTASRAERTKELVDLLGDRRTRESGRPERLVVVATQIAEQSFDVDADLLVTDLAPTDLLLQRIGRLHRHDRPAADRPVALRNPRVVVIGQWGLDRIPPLGEGLTYVYGASALLRAAGLIEAGARWPIPSAVPVLVSQAYGEQLAVPEAWASEVASARQSEAAEEQNRAARAATFHLTGTGFPRADLASLHATTAAGTPDEARTVRDGDPTTEVALVVQTERGYRTLGGTPLGPNGEACSTLAVAREVWGDTVRVRDEPWVATLGPLPAWEGVAKIGHLPCVVLDEALCWEGPGASLRYDRELGLLIVRHRGGR